MTDQTAIVKKDKSQTPVTINEHGFQIRTIDEAWRWGTAIAKAGIFPVVSTPERAIAVRQLADDNNVPFSLVAGNVAFINNRASMYGDALIGIAHANGQMEDFEETIEGDGDKMEAVCRVVRRGTATPIIRKFTVADAKAAGLWGKAGPWKSYPKRMLQMRARSWALRDAGLVQGIIAREEAEDIIKPADVVRPAEIAAPEVAPDVSDLIEGNVKEAEVVSTKPVSEPVLPFAERPKHTEGCQKCQKCDAEYPLTDDQCPKCGDKLPF